MFVAEFKTVYTPFVSFLRIFIFYGTTHATKLQILEKIRQCSL